MKANEKLEKFYKIFNEISFTLLLEIKSKVSCKFRDKNNSIKKNCAISPTNTFHSQKTSEYRNVINSYFSVVRID